MQERRDEKYREIIDNWSRKLSEGSVPPWKVEEDLAEGSDVPIEESFAVAAMCRRKYIEEVTGEAFDFIRVPENPYKTFYFCPHDNLTWELDGRDSYRRCSLCGGGASSQRWSCPACGQLCGRK